MESPDEQGLQAFVANFHETIEVMETRVPGGKEFIMTKNSNHKRQVRDFAAQAGIKYLQAHRLLSTG